MKRKFSPFVTLFILCLFFSLISCDKDDGGDGLGDESSLAGTWVCIQAEGYYQKPGGEKENYKDTFEAKDEIDVYIFTKDGFFRNYGKPYYDEDGDKVYDFDFTGDWEIDGETLFMYDDEGDTEKYGIKMSGNKLMLTYDYSDRYDIFHDVYTYVKVK